MLESITQKLSSVFDKIRGRGALTEKDVDSALNEVRKALLEADKDEAEYLQEKLAKVPYPIYIG